MDTDALERFGIREEKKLSFLGKDRRDAKRRLPSDPHYDPKTLYLPLQFLKSLTSGQRQWWEFKSKHMDKVMFFKMGKFYELFEMDAHVGVKELDLQYMKGEQPHCGFPEKNFSVNLEKLARKGYRVLVVEQTETPIIWRSVTKRKVQKIRFGGYVVFFTQVQYLIWFTFSVCTSERACRIRVAWVRLLLLFTLTPPRPAEKGHYTTRDPIVALKEYLFENNLATEADLKAIEKKQLGFVNR
ncbi:DNA mismatch repair protein MSH6-like [Silene latifolia]|uniref:DNA mismatch repair protein MSH6-like n=1 Tax=Silene latifolia TaxID=37657 RepID=UPI003D7702AC